MKQTAVEWLVEQLPLIQQEGLRDIIEQAKEMEKEQMQDLFKAGVNYGAGYVIATEWGEETTEFDFENYYNRNFKKQTYETNSSRMVSTLH